MYSCGNCTAKGVNTLRICVKVSKYKVKVGNVVERGQIIALSGHSGYTLGAHLHLGIRINNIAIDPEKFLELFK